MGVQHQFHLDLYRRYYERGIEAHKAGDLGRARIDLLKAAEILFKLANESAGDLQRVRKERAFKLLELGKSIDPGKAKDDEPRPAPKTKSAATAQDAEETGGADWLLSEVPDVKLEEVAGLEDVKAAIRKRVLYPFQHPEITEKYKKQAGGGVLLYGPPGTGKTMIAKAIANEVEAAFFSVKCSDIISKWVGEAEKNLKKLFDAARQQARAVVFMDETEAIVSKRGGDSTVMNRVIPEFLAQVDGVQGQHSALLLLGATNRPWDMDDAALRTGRFGELIYVPLPDVEARYAILGSRLAGIPLAEDIEIMSLAEKTDGLSGADLVGLCEQAKDAPYEREIESGVAQHLEVSDFDSALERFRPSVTKKLLARYEKFSHDGQ